jgi:hypothetical protein
MVSIASLWLPILLSAVAVFIASSIIHMALPYHRSDYARLPAEDDVMEALRKFDIPAGEYLFPRPQNPKDMKSPVFLEKMKRGPVGLLTIRPSGPPSMGKNLAFWFLYCIVVGIFAAFISGRALPAGVGFRPVSHFAGVTAFAGYVLALWQGAIWYWRSGTTTLKSSFDGLIYAVLTAAIFGWLWPPR